MSWFGIIYINVSDDFCDLNRLTRKNIIAQINFSSFALERKTQIGNFYFLTFLSMANEV